MSHKFSMGLRSGDLDGQFINSTPCWFRQAVHIRAVSWTGIVVHENEPFTNCTCTWCDLGPRHDSFVQLLCPCVGHKDRCYSPWIPPPPHHIKPSTITIVIPDVTLGVSFFWTSPYSHTSVTTRNQESAFICKENGSPGVPEQTSDDLGGMLQWVLDIEPGSSASQTISVQPIANCLISNTDICSLLEIILKSSRRRPTITACHVPEITILTRCCSPPPPPPPSLPRSSSVP